MNAAERAAFLTRQGWRPELSEPERRTIEEAWPDHAVEEALLTGF